MTGTQGASAQRLQGAKGAWLPFLGIALLLCGVCGGQRLQNAAQPQGETARQPGWGAVEKYLQVAVLGGTNHEAEAMRAFEDALQGNLDVELNGEGTGGTLGGFAPFAVVCHAAEQAARFAERAAREGDTARARTWLTLCGRLRAQAANSPRHGLSQTKLVERLDVVLENIERAAWNIGSL